MNGGFVPIRRGLEEHLVNGSIGAFEAGVYLTIHMQADYRTGVWTGSAARLLATMPRGSTLRDMQRALNRLSQIGFIRIFHRHGVRGNYRVLIDKFEPTCGALKGQRLNASLSDSWEHPYCEPCAVADAVNVGVGAPYQEIDVKSEKKSEKKSSRARKSSASGDRGLAALPRFEDYTLQIPDFTLRQFNFAVARISSRANTPPRSKSYWDKSLGAFFADIDGECASFLIEEALRLLKETNSSIGDIAESLKSAAAVRDLPYTPDLIADSIDAASERLEHERAVLIYVSAGAGPSVGRSASALGIK